jgi:PKD repeat protein
MNTAVGAGYVPPLVSGLIVEPQSGYAPLTVRFTDKSSGGTIENRLFGTWNLGDGTNAEGTSVIRRYEQPGTYQVSRTVRTSCGSETSSATVQVHKADFTSKAIPEALNTYQFNDQSEGNPSAWLWDFSDGTTALDQNPIHTWKKPGRYPVGLRVAGENGSGTVVREIVIPDNQENQEKTSQSSLERIYLSSP